MRPQEVRCVLHSIPLLVSRSRPSACRTPQARRNARAPARASPRARDGAVHVRPGGRLGMRHRAGRARRAGLERLHHPHRRGRRAGGGPAPAGGGGGRRRRRPLRSAGLLERAPSGDVRGGGPPRVRRVGRLDPPDRGPEPRGSAARVPQPGPPRAGSRPRCDGGPPHLAGRGGARGIPVHRRADRGDRQPGAGSGDRDGPGIRTAGLGRLSQPRPQEPDARLYRDGARFGTARGARRDQRRRTEARARGPHLPPGRAAGRCLRRERRVDGAPESRSRRSARGELHRAGRRLAPHPLPDPQRPRRPQGRGSRSAAHRVLPLRARRRGSDDGREAGRRSGRRSAPWASRAPPAPRARRVPERGRRALPPTSGLGNGNDRAHRGVEAERAAERSPPPERQREGTARSPGTLAGRPLSGTPASPSGRTSCVDADVAASG